ncbi:MAG: hypothetical protein ACLFO5_06700, partial [Opitutales bacterium]
TVSALACWRRPGRRRSAKSVISDSRIIGIEGEKVRIRILNRDTNEEETRLIIDQSRSAHGRQPKR